MHTRLLVDGPSAVRETGDRNPYTHTSAASVVFTGGDTHGSMEKKRNDNNSNSNEGYKIDTKKKKKSFRKTDGRGGRPRRAREARDPEPNKKLWLAHDPKTTTRRRLCKLRTPSERPHALPTARYTRKMYCIIIVIYFVCIHKHQRPRAHFVRDLRRSRAH